MNLNKVICADNLEYLKTLPDNSVDSVVTDAPYGLSFMNKKWDYELPSVEFWKEVNRVLKPGGHVLCFGGTRTFHRLVVNIEDAGFEIRDAINWLYGNGFPKGANISLSIDKRAGQIENRGKGFTSSENDVVMLNQKIKAPAYISNITDDAKKWDGWNTALKPSHEIICLARKPLSENSVMDNVLKWGTGAVNVNACRVPVKERPLYIKRKGGKSVNTFGNGLNGGSDHLGSTSVGRYPSNTIFGCDCSGEYGHTSDCSINDLLQFHEPAINFFYVAKPSPKERDKGLENNDSIKAVTTGAGVLGNGLGNAPKVNGEKHTPIKNFHPTVKPIALMSYLIKLVTPVGGIVLDPFCGSGTTGIAAKQNGFKYILIEREKNYAEIAEGRINGIK